MSTRTPAASALRALALLAAPLLFAAPLGAQVWDTPASHPGDPRFHQPDFPLVFVASTGHGDAANETPPHLGLDVHATSNPSAHGPAGGLYVLVPSGQVKKLFPLPQHESVPDLIDTPLGELHKGAVAEPTVSEDGRTLYFAYFHDATWEPSGGGFQSRKLSFKGSDLYRLDIGPLVDDPALDPAELGVRRLTFKQYTGPAKSSVTQTDADRFRDALNPTLAQQASGTNYWGTMDMHLIEVRTQAGLAAVWVSNRARLANSNEWFGEANHNFDLFQADILADGSLGPPSRFQYYTTTSALSPTPLRDGLAFSYQSSTEEGRRWEIQSIDSEGRWKTLLGYAHSSELFHLGTLIVERDAQGQLVDSFVGVKYYNVNNEGFGQLQKIRMSDAGLNTFVLGPWGTSPRQLSEVLTLGVSATDVASNQVVVDGQPRYIGKFSSPRAGRVGGEYFVAYTPTSANVSRADADGRRNVFESEIRYRPDLEPFEPHEPINVASGAGLYAVVRDASAQYDLIWPTPVLSWLERTGEPEQRVAAPIADRHSTIQPGLPFAEVGSSALWNSDIRPYDCYQLGSRPFNPNHLHDNEEIQLVRSQEGLRYLQDRTDFCQYLLPETVLGIAVNLTGQRTDFQSLNVRGYETDGTGKVEAVEHLGVYSVLEQNQDDQSFRVRIPANVPFEFHLLDRRYGMKLADVRSWHSLKPRESRTDCGGCHQHEAGFKIPFDGSEASRKPALDLTQLATFVDYDADCRPVVRSAATPTLAAPEWKADIWPGFDEHCGNCHNVVRSTNSAALLALDFGTEEDAYDKLVARNYASSALGALGSPAFWAAYGERTDGRDNTIPDYQPDYANAAWGYHFSSIHATSPGLCAASEPEWASWVRLFGQWIDNHMPRDTGASVFDFKYDRYQPTADFALSPDLARLVVGFWDDRGTVALTVELEGNTLASFPSIANGSVTVDLPAGRRASDSIRVVVSDPAHNRQVLRKSLGRLMDERTGPAAQLAEQPGNARPHVEITGPASGSQHPVGTSVSFAARASDLEDGDLGASLSWSSNLAGAIGSGASFSTVNLAPGEHTITASVTDSAGASASDSIVLLVTGPAQLPAGLVLHLESTQGVSASGNHVTGWADLSGNGNHLSATGEPTLAPGLTPSGLPALVLDATDGLQRVHAQAPIAGLPEGNADRTMFVVARYNGLTWSAGTAYGDSAGNRAFGLGLRHPAGELMLQGFGYENDLVSTTPGLGAGWLVHSALLAAGTATLFEADTPIAQWSHAYQTGHAKLVIGQELGGSGSVAMDVAAVLIYDRALTASERQAANAYLRQKYLGSGVNEPPTLTIQAPLEGSQFALGEPVSLAASASDPEEGDLSGAITWSSDLDGALGTGGALTLTTLGLGTHALTAVVTDGAGQTASATVHVGVTAPGAIVPGAPIALFDGQSLAGLQPWFSGTGFGDPQAVFRAEQGLLHVTGNGWGALATSASYRDYVLVLEFQWGEQTWAPRLGNARSAGLLIHGHGSEGGWNGVLLPSVQAQLMEGSTGDLLLLQGTAPMSATGFVEQVPCTFDTWNCRGGFRWNAAGGPQSLLSIPGQTLHWSRWDPDWVDVLGFRGDEDVERPHGDWNQLVVAAAGDTLEVFLNGVKVNEVLGVAPTAGRILLEVEFAEFFVRRWELLPLGASPGPALTNTSLPSGTQDSSYAATLVAVGGTPPRTWTLASGALPPGLGLGAATGSITGAPSASGSFPFVARVTDAQGLSSEGAFVLEVAPATSVLPTAGLVLQLESTEFVSGGPVTSWSDLSGRGNHVFAAGDPELLLVATPTGKPAIHLDGQGDKLERLHATHALSGLPTGNADRSVFLVARYDASSASAGIAYGKGASNQAFGLMIRHPSGLLALQGFGGDQDLVSSTQGTGAGWLTQSVVHAGGQARLFKDGAQIAQWLHTYDTTLAKLVIGAEIANLGFVDMQVAAVLVYDRALGDAERSAVESYLSGKYLNVPRPR